MRICPTCKTSIEHMNARARFCCKPCYARSPERALYYSRIQKRKRALAKQAREAMPPRQCSLPNCCAPIIGRRTDAKYCSLKCRELAKYERRPELRAVAVERSRRWREEHPERVSEHQEANRIRQRDRWANNPAYRAAYAERRAVERLERNAALKLIREIEANGLEALL